MPATTAQTFIDALWHLEETRDAGPIAALFAPNASVSNPLVLHPAEGPEGAADFWQTYRATFDLIRSEFHHILEDRSAAMLEWTSTGTARGHDVRYSGVTVLEFENDGIVAFRTYFDTNDLDQQLGGAALVSPEGRNRPSLKSGLPPST